jgi:thymidylate kinase
VLAKISSLIAELNTNRIRYCHWKSNFSLAATVSGRTDVDLLIHRQDAPLFRSILTQLCFRPARNTDGKPFPSVEHHYALDDDSSDFVHVHAYYRVITGESLTKNYRLPVEEMLLRNTREVGSVRVPTKGAELVIFTLRMMLKHTSLMEFLLLSRYWKQVQDEINWLVEADSLDEALDLVRCWLPPVDANLFSTCIVALKSPTHLLQRIILGHRLRSRLRVYARHSAIRAWLSGVQKFMVMLFRRLSRSNKGMMPLSGGAVIAFVGPEATGKSTLLSEISHWLGEHFAVERIHAGKPTSTTLTALPNLLLPVLRSMLPAYRSTRLETKYSASKRSVKSNNNFPLIYAVRSVLLAYDRRSLLTRAFGRAANGTIVLCDRYPSLRSGAPDSPQLSHLAVPPGKYSVRRLLARVEARLYREIPPPDLVIYLSAPLEVTVLRNVTRSKKEPEDYVRRRHAQSSNLEFGRTPIYKINTDQPLDQTVLEVKKAIWNAL